MLTVPQDFELSGLIDGGLHTHEQAQFIVHLQPVPFHEVLDACPRFAHRLVVRLHFAIEPFVPLAPQITEDFLGAEGQQGERQQTPKQPGERVLAGKAHVGGVLGLIDDPVMNQTLD